MFCSRFKYGILTFKLHNSLITDYENMRMSYDFFSGIILFILRFFFFSSVQFFSSNLSSWSSLFISSVCLIVSLVFCLDSRAVWKNSEQVLFCDASEAVVGPFLSTAYLNHCSVENKKVFCFFFICWWWWEKFYMNLVQTLNDRCVFN